MKYETHQPDGQNRLQCSQPHRLLPTPPSTHYATPSDFWAISNDLTIESEKLQINKTKINQDANLRTGSTAKTSSVPARMEAHTCRALAPRKVKVQGHLEFSRTAWKQTRWQNKISKQKPSLLKSQNICHLCK